jgi:hypothetical protein
MAKTTKEADARHVWRIHKGPVLLWEAAQARNGASQRARTPHGRAERVA